MGKHLVGENVRVPFDIYSSRSPSPISYSPPSVNIPYPLPGQPPEPNPRKEHSSSSSWSSRSSDSGSDNEAVFRKRMTSIVDNKLVSADYNSRSCEDLTKVAGPILKSLHESATNSVHSDSEVVSARLAKVQNGMSKHLKSKLGWQHRSASEVTENGHSTESHPSIPEPPPRGCSVIYDHLGLKQDELSPSSSPEPETATSLPIHPSQRNNYDTLEPKGIRIHSTSSEEEEEEHTSRHSTQYHIFEPITASPQHTQSTKRGGTYDRKVRVTGRRHTYEEVDLVEERPASSSSSGTSPEPSPIPVHSTSESTKASIYHRKVRVTGRKHTYEFVDPLDSPTTSGDGGVSKKSAVDPRQPRRSQPDNEEPSPVKWKISSEVLSNSTRPLPLQFVSLGQSDETAGLSTVVEEEASIKVAGIDHSSKKPCPPPRSHDTRDSPSSTQRPIFRRSKTEEEEQSHRQSPTRFSSRHSPTLYGRQAPLAGVRPTRSSAPSGPRPPLPPKPSFESTHQRSRSDDYAGASETPPPPSRPPKPQHMSSFEKECRPLPNYTQVYVSTLPAHSPAPRQPSRSKSERERTNPYTEINHLATFQLRTMIEARNLEKECATPHK